MVYCSQDKEDCIKVMKRYQHQPDKEWGISIEDAIELW